MSTAEIETTEADVLFEQAMKLSEDQRADLGERLLLSVPVVAGANSEFAAEIERRIRAHESDPSSSIPLEDALEEARRVAEEAS